MDRILIIDDEKSIRLTLTAFLEKDGYEVFNASCAKEAIAMFEEHSFLAVIMDIMIPGQNGIELLKQLKLLHPKVPVIMITGYPELETAIEAIKADAFDYLVKPFSGQTIRDVVSKAVLVSRLSTDVDILEKQNKIYRDYLEETVKKRTAHLQKANEQLQLLSLAVEQSPAAIIITNAEGTIEHVNPKFTQITGYSFEQAVGENPRILKSGKQTDAFYRDLWETISSGKIWRGEFNNKRRDGTLFWESAIISPVINESGEITHYLAVKEDITEKKELLRKEQKIQAKLIHTNKMISLGTLASGVAHEINNPNNFIMFNSGLLKNASKDALKYLKEYQRKAGPLMIGGLPLDEMTEAIPKLLDGITDGAERIKRIVNNLRDFSRQDTETDFIAVDLNDIVKKSISMLEYKIYRTTNNFSVNYYPNLPKIMASGHQIEQVVVNLITNALHALLDPTYEIQVSTDLDKKSKYALLFVKDNGVGMSEEVLNHLTEPFYTTRQNAGGTGLGLSISYSIIEEHKGAMIFKSRPGKGTTVKVKLPLAEPFTDEQKGFKQGEGK